MSAHCVPVSEGGPSVFCVLCEKRRSLGGRDEKKRRRRGETEWKEVVLRNFESCVKLKALVLWWECPSWSCGLEGKKKKKQEFGDQGDTFFPPRSKTKTLKQLWLDTETLKILALIFISETLDGHTQNFLFPSFIVC